MSTRLGLTDNAPAPTSLLPGAVVADRFRIVSQLGAGAMGSVFLAEHVTLGRRVALKTIHRALLGSAEAVARFEREALASARIDHPNVVAATDVVHLGDGSPVLVLDYVQGRSLTQRLAEDGPLAAREALPLLEGLASALVTAHDAGIVHRDLKPDNLLIVERPGVPVALKILDFGIAKLVGDAAATVTAQAPGTQLGMVYGTPRYMAPEQAVGQAVDARVDLYAVGVIAYELVTGRVPFEGDDLMAIVSKQLTEAPAPLPSAVPAGLATLIARLLAPKPEDRLASAHELLAALHAVSREPAASPAPAAPVTPATRKESTPVEGPPRADAFARIFGVFALAAMIALTVVYVRKRSGSSAAGALAAIVKPDAASTDELARAKAAGRGALEDLAYLYPHDATVRRALVEAAHAEGAPLLVAKHLAGLAEERPGDAEELAGLAELDAQKSEEAAAALVPLLAERLGTRGADALVALADKKGFAKKVAAEQLARAEIREKISKGAAVWLDARTAKSCADRKALLPRMVGEGDERLAPLVASWSAGGGCGFLSLADCNPCLRAKEPAAQLAELRARFGDAGARGR
jgi:hypothetical protein